MTKTKTFYLKWALPSIKGNKKYRKTWISRYPFNPTKFKDQEGLDRKAWRKRCIHWGKSQGWVYLGRATKQEHIDQ